MLAITFTLIEVVGATVVSFALGFGLGYVVARQTPEGNNQDVRMRIATFIVIVWAISVLATIIVPDYETSIWVHAIMGGICGYLFGIDNPLLGNNG